MSSSRIDAEAFAEHEAERIVPALIERCIALGHRDVAVMVLNVLSHTGQQFIAMARISPEAGPLIVLFNDPKTSCSHIHHFSMEVAIEISAPPGGHGHWLMALDEDMASCTPIDLDEYEVPESVWATYLSLPDSAG